MSLISESNLKSYNKPKSLVDSVADYLRESIVNGTLKSGEKIANSVIAQKLGVSMIPLREAVRILETEGLIISHQGRGSWVANTSRKDLEETYEMREMIELMAISLIERHVEAGEDIKEKIKLLLSSKTDKELGVEFCLNFHRNLVILAGNSKLLNVLDMFQNNIRRYHRLSYTIRHMGGSNTTDDSWVKEHLTFFELLIQKNFDECRKEVSLHINNLKKLLLEQIEFSDDRPSEFDKPVLNMKSSKLESMFEGK